MDLHDEWLSSTRKYIKFDQWETGKTLYSILHRIMDLTNMKKKDILLKLGKAILIVSFFIVGFLVAKMIFSLFLKHR